MKTKTESIEFYGELQRETAGAYLVFDGFHHVWLPKSQVLRLRQIRGQGHEFIIPYWLAKQKGIV